MSEAAEKLPFDMESNPDFVLVRLRGFWDAESANKFLSVLTEGSPGVAKHVFVECVGLFSLNAHWTRAFGALASSLKKSGKQLRLLAVPNPVVKQIKQEGLEATLKCCANAHAAMVDLGLAKSQSLDVHFINPFLVATANVLESQAQTKATQGKIYRRQPGEKMLGDISGVIGLVSDSFTGSVVISFPEATFLKVMSRMLGEDYKEITPEIQDGAAELTNIIFGQAKVGLNERGFGIKTALPSVVSGRDHSVIQATTGPRVAIPFESDAGPFIIEICLST